MSGVFSESREYYDAYWSSAGYSPTDIQLSEGLRRVLERYVGPTSWVIDVGCGDGSKVGSWITSNAARYTGFDVSPEAVELARARGLDAQVVEDAAALPLAAGSVDAAVCLEILEHLFDPIRAVDELRRVLRPGGILIVSVPNLTNWRNRIDFALLGRWHPGGDDRSAEEPWRDPHLRFFTTRILRTMLRRAGFAVDELSAVEELTALHRVPGLMRSLRERPAGRATNLLAAAAPAVFGSRLYSVARRPGA